MNGQIETSAIFLKGKFGETGHGCRLRRFVCLCRSNRSTSGDASYHQPISPDQIELQALSSKTVPSGKELLKDIKPNLIFFGKGDVVKVNFHGNSSTIKKGEQP